ncbi:hypothetical protein CDL12_18133 [Handroanthus impetiginosus]|uniref:Uncharacterized protein n=1 Tax=Handroanthus impetiginosus TaxID=429701 RepID=A0A2G9GVI1_9LAMI|nr:hypothetical protein CDL12_18133 [Handroanthus impetiginosus]
MYIKYLKIIYNLILALKKFDQFTDSLLPMTHGIHHAPPGRQLEVKVGKCRNLTDCLCPQRCTPGQFYCRSGQQDILVGDCIGDAGCLCPRRIKDKFCTLEIAFVLTVDIIISTPIFNIHIYRKKEKQKLS